MKRKHRNITNFGSRNVSLLLRTGNATTQIKSPLAFRKANNDPIYDSSGFRASLTFHS